MLRWPQEALRCGGVAGLCFVRRGAAPPCSSATRWHRASTGGKEGGHYMLGLAAAVVAGFATLGPILNRAAGYAPRPPGEQGA